jgi:hypothetical protein
MGIERYYTLMASLPALPPLFSERQPPLSRYSLEQRLRMLEADDAHMLARMGRLLLWSRLPLEITDQEMVEMAASVIDEIDNPLLHEVAQWRLELRTVVAALRRRAAGEPAPAKGEVWGFGRWTRTLELNWGKSDFGLAGALPWVVDFNDRIEKMDSLGFERSLLQLVWTYLSRKAEGHYFDLEAVALYAQKWDVIHRWSVYDATDAAKRFDELMQASWGAYTDELEKALRH